MKTTAQLSKGYISGGYYTILGDHEISWLVKNLDALILLYVEHLRP